MTLKNLLREWTTLVAEKAEQQEDEEERREEGEGEDFEDEGEEHCGAESRAMRTIGRMTF